MSAQKRIAKELAEVTSNPPAGMIIGLVDESNVHNWDITMDGPEGSPYVGGKFKLLLTLPVEYPFKPPTINFKTRIWHPNVTFDEQGSMCIGILKGDTWKPSSRIMNVLIATQNLLIEPVPDDALETSSAELFKNNRPLYEKEAKKYTAQYAIGK
ncbi:hypothetical protein OIDMADRAFT_161166 [Oidiodendron maius Zn]|uniref:E2 ubiquitin-conjugating enzyme n=1 Tax=Oidiodendron maius (strain Zn) TaxID=913774 RepID=A0A0C3HF12_OIDMZ|nr:hypothetical protein OIDMADRAFT_161166 [Oidiodendron maius Zn]